MSKPDFAIVVGTSAGGMGALAEFVAQLHPGMNAAVFIVMHLSRTSFSEFLKHRLEPATQLTCRIATQDMEIEKDHIYFAASNAHLLIKKGTIVLGLGPEENRWRPSIDVLFRSAAVAYNTRSIGIILTGSLDDGTAGMLAIKKSGGVTIVQDPNEAEYPDMPLSVLDNMEVSHCLPLAAMGDLLVELTEDVPEEVPAPAEIKLESDISERVVVEYTNVKQIGEKSIYACPDCGGGLWNIITDANGAGGMSRYRCHIGHSYSEKDLAAKQGEVFESTLWIALRIMEERRNLLKKIHDDNLRRGFTKVAAGYQVRLDEFQKHVNRMKEILFDKK